MNKRIVIMQSGSDRADSKMFRAYLPAFPGGVRKPVGVSCSTTGNIKFAIVKCAAKAFKKLNGGELEEIETRVKVDTHPQANTWLVELTESSAPVRASGRTYTLVKKGKPVQLDRCPVGLFEFQGTLALMTEYSGCHGRDAYITDSGETFWGGVTEPKARGQLMVQPLEVKS